ncbi:Hook-related protein family [Phytophthora cactorum]|nr:Hook-related protein family [Phytophthora cactorum]
MEDLCDGVFLSKIMHHIDSEYVNLEQINEQPGGNWALKSNNLKRCYLVDPLLIAKENNVHEVSKLTELLLGCAVQCPNKSEYIHPIMQMGASEQASLMHAIENLMHRFHPTSLAACQTLVAVTRWLTFFYGAQIFGYGTRETRANGTLRANSNGPPRAADKYSALESERDQLRSERQNTLTRDNKKIQQIVDNEVHALQMQMEEKDLELNRVKRESGERLMMLENEVRRQADELDISRSKLGTLNKLEASVTKYKKKLEEMNSLRAQVRELETLNAQYLDKVVDLESTIKTMPGLKNLVEKYKNQVVELETANVQASSNLNVKEQKIRRLQEELDSALGGKEFLESQVEELRTQVSSMQYREGTDDAMAAGESSAVNGGGLSADMLLGRDSVSGLRERVARLERENAELKSGNADAGQAELANDLDMAVKAKESLQVSLFQMQKQNDQLEGAAAAGAAGFATPATLEAGVAMGPGGAMQAPVPTSGSVVVTSSNNALSSAQIAEYQDKLEKLEIEAEAVDSLRLKEKESVINELSEQRAKLENYTKKTLHAVQTKYMKKMKEVRASYSREQALMMSSFYEIGTEMQRRTMMPQGPVAGAPGAGSWLANKRTEERAKRRQGA